MTNTHLRLFITHRTDDAIPNYDTPTLTVGIFGLSVDRVSIQPVEAARTHTMPFYNFSMQFTATAAMGTLTFSTAPAHGGDSAVLIDNVAIQRGS